MKADDLSRVDAAFFTMNGYVSVIFFVFWAADIFLGPRANHMLIHIEDQRLRPILEKVQAGERLDFEDGVPFIKSPIFSPSARWPTWFESACTAMSPVSTSTATSIPPTFASRAAGYAPSESVPRIPRRIPGRSTSVGRARVKAGAKRSRSSTSSADCTGTDARLVLRHVSRSEAALPGGAFEGLHHGGGRLSWRNAASCRSRDA